MRLIISSLRSVSLIVANELRLCSGSSLSLRSLALPSSSLASFCALVVTVDDDDDLAFFGVEFVDFVSSWAFSFRLFLLKIFYKTN